MTDKSLGLWEPLVPTFYYAHVKLWWATQHDVVGCIWSAGHEFDTCASSLSDHFLFDLCPN